MLSRKDPPSKLYVENFDYMSVIYHRKYSWSTIPPIYKYVSEAMLDIRLFSTHMSSTIISGSNLQNPIPHHQMKTVTQTRQLIHYNHLVPPVHFLYLRAINSKSELTMALCKMSVVSFSTIFTCICQLICFSPEKFSNVM